MEGLRVQISLLAAIGTLALALIAARSHKNPLARAIAGLCFVLFGWNIAVVAQHGGRSHPAFEAMDAVCTALSPPFVLEVVLRFTGGVQRWRVLRGATWLFASGLAVSSIIWVGPWLDSFGWAALFMPMWLATFVFELVIVLRHLRAASEAGEKARTRIVLAALAIGGACGSSDVAHQLGFSAPHLGAIGTFVSACLLLTLATRLDLKIAARTWLYALGMTASLVIAYVVVLSVFAGAVGAQVLFACAIALVGVAIARELATASAEEKARTQRLALVGRFAAQMTHDLRSPLTALLGAVQLVKGDKPDPEDVALVEDQAKRIKEIIDRYDRMARVEPQLTLVAANEVARGVARAQGVPFTGVELEIDADRALLESAVENVVRNAVEAATAAKVRVEAVREGDAAVIRCVDQGPGMDARTLERATEDFFTTKATGSGLGLAFSRRVVEAHGGTLVLASKAGHGTTVELRFPARHPPETPVQLPAQSEL